MRNHTKQKIFSIAVIMICLSVAGTGTYAYFNDNIVTHNVITTGNIDLALNQVSTAQLTVMPSTSVERPVIVSNDSNSNDTWVRVQIDKKIVKADQTTGDAALIAMQYQNGAYNSACWTYRDGYYYYNNKLAPDEETEPLFDAIVFSPTMGNEYQCSTATVSIYAQGTQVVHNGSSALDATEDSWPSND